MICGKTILTDSIAFFYSRGLTSIVKLHTDEFFVLLKHYKPGGNRAMMKGYGPAPAERTNDNGGIVK